MCKLLDFTAGKLNGTVNGRLGGKYRYGRIAMTNNADSKYETTFDARLFIDFLLLANGNLLSDKQLPYKKIN